MTTRSSRPLVISLVLIALTTSRLALAEPNAADVETARGLYVEGLQLRDAGKLEVSLARFKAAHALAATPITSLELGRAHVMLAELVEAREVLLSVDRLPVHADESAKAEKARVEARAMADQLRERIPALRIVFRGEVPASPKVTIDGVLIPTEALAVPRRVNPGNHTIVAEANGGARATASVLLVEREVRTVMLAFDKGAARAGPPRHETPGTPAAGASGPTPWFYVGVTTAAVGVVVGSVSGVIAISKANTVDEACSGTVCPRSVESDLSTSRTMGTVSTIAFGVAAVGTVVAVVAWFARPSTGTAVRTTPNGLRWTW